MKKIQKTPKKNKYINLIYLIILVAVLAGGATYFERETTKAETVSISKIAEEIKADRIKSVEVRGTEVTATTKEDKKLVSEISGNQQITTTL
jgi:ATP-dependent Zn protease